MQKVYRNIYYNLCDENSIWGFFRDNLNKSMRLKNYDYRDEGYYYITAVTHSRKSYFGIIESMEVILSDTGKIATEELLRCAVLREKVFIDEYVIMPDHVHFIMIISDTKIDGTEAHPGFEITAEHEYYSSISPKAESVSAIVRSYKSAVTKRCHDSGIMDFSWQRGFYDRIIRDQNELNAARAYIRQNPEKWRLRSINPS